MDLLNLNVSALRMRFILIFLEECISTRVFLLFVVLLICFFVFLGKRIAVAV